VSVGAVVVGNVGRPFIFSVKFATIKSTEETLFLVYPKLKVTGGLGSIARKGDLGDLAVENVEDFSISDIAHLVVFLNKNAAFVASTLETFGHERITGFIGSTHITVDTTPSIGAIACSVISNRSINAVTQTATYW
jgi:hypothetical protein